MRKVVIPLLILLTSCTSFTGAVNVINPTKFVQTGVYPLLIISELETNFSSLLIDKTKATIENFAVKPYEILPEGSTIFIMPTSVTVNSNRTFDTYYSNMLTNYFILNNMAIPTKDLSKADYILRTDITESFENRIGKNYSRLQVTIMEQSEQPVFFSTLNVISKSDENFYYYPAKSARPVKELTLIALEETLSKAIPRAFGDKVARGEVQ